MKENNKRRRKGDGSITRLPSGKFRGRISLEGTSYSCVADSESEVKKKLESYRRSILKQEVIPKKIRVNEFIENWLHEVKRPSLKPASYDRLERTYQNHIMKSAVGRSQLGNLTSKDLQRLINDKSESLSYSSLKKIYELLNSCLKYAVANRDLNFNPMQTVLLPKEENLKKKTKKMQVFSKDELNRIERVAKLTYESGEPRFKYAYFFILLANTGLRCGEGLALSWRQVDLEKKLIHVDQNAAVVKKRSEEDQKKYEIIITSVKTKTGNRIIPCNDKAMEAILWYKDYQTSHGIISEFVVCNENGGLVSQKALPKSFKAILKAANVSYKNIHALRHTFASELVAAAVDIKLVSSLLGHSSVRITYDTYVHSDFDKAVEAVKKLNCI